MAQTETPQRATTRRSTSIPARPDPAPRRNETEAGTRLAFFVMMALLGLALLFFIAMPFMM